jgi:hypothetical protein
MAFNFAWIILIVAIALVYVFFTLKKYRHKVWAFLLISIIIFLFITGTIAFAGKGINFQTNDGLKQAGNLYVAWLGHSLSNLKVLTGNAIKMDWTSTNKNETN